jgi:hypothetical protein
MESIKIIIDKLSTYNIFNFLLPGVIFIILTKEITGYNLIQENNLAGGFLYYFIGMVVSRVGSILIEPILIRINFVKFKHYKFFVEAGKLDSKLDLLSEVNNTYRTILSTMILTCFEYVYMWLKSKYNISHEITLVIIIGFITLLFLFSYRKQTNYISKRIEANLNE